MQVDRQEVLRIAKLARIELTQKEQEDMARDLSAILDHVERINELDTSRIPETDHALEVTDAFHEDDIQPSLERERALAMADSQENGFFTVPPIID